MVVPETTVSSMMMMLVHTGLGCAYHHPLPLLLTPPPHTHTTRTALRAPVWLCWP
jgi:hypothetical protein